MGHLRVTLSVLRFGDINYATVQLIKGRPVTEVLRAKRKAIRPPTP
jgi:hypothetical protein